MDTQPLPTLDTREIGIECSCGFKRRATKIAAGGAHWNGREIESLHWFQIGQEQVADAREVEAILARGEGNAPVVVRTHQMSMGLIATMDWLPLTAEEHVIGEAWLAGQKAGTNSAMVHMRKRLATVTFEEFGE